MQRHASTAKSLSEVSCLTGCVLPSFMQELLNLVLTSAYQHNNSALKMAKSVCN